MRVMEFVSSNDRDDFERTMSKLAFRSYRTITHIALSVGSVPGPSVEDGGLVTSDGIPVPVTNYSALVFYEDDFSRERADDGQLALSPVLSKPLGGA